MIAASVGFGYVPVRSPPAAPEGTPPGDVLPIAQPRVLDPKLASLAVPWLAREGTYIREAKNAIDAHKHLVDALNALLQHDKEVEIAIEPKPNEPMDHAYIPTIGHALAFSARSKDPKRVGGLIESAHAILAGLDPFDEMAFALSANKLWSVHLNDQNGLKYDQDKSFGAANLRMAFNQVRVLELAGYAKSGRFVGLDVKAMRTQKSDVATKHLSNSRRIFLALVEKVRTFDKNLERQLIESRDYEQLELHVLELSQHGEMHCALDRPHGVEQVVPRLRGCAGRS